MSDQQLLELAAKAAGMDPPFDKNGVSSAWVGTMESGHWWEPLENDGDALRLAVALDIRVRWHSVLNQALAQGFLFQEITVNGEDHGGDRYAATRRAIVRAAAEIGKATS